MTLFSHIAVHAQSNPDRRALTGQDVQLSYQELHAAVDHYTQILNKLNCRVLALHVDNGPQWVVLDLAASQAGICLVPIPPFFSAQQVQYALQQSGANAVITDQPHQLRGLAGNLLEQQEEGIPCLGIELHCIRTQLPETRIAQDIAKITFTSGTTGEPKGVMLRQAQIDTVVNSLVKAVCAQPGDRHLCLMPLAVLLENLAGVYVSLQAGAEVVLPDLTTLGIQGATGINIQRFAATLQNYQPTTLITTPQLLQVLVHLEQHQAGTLSSLRFIALGGAPVSERLLSQAENLGLPVYEGYGLSECASVTTLNTPQARRRGSVGRPLPHIGVGISPEGEVMLTGHGFAGYLGQPNAADTNTWASGDLGYLDDEGFLFLTGRKRNIFITAMGRNVSPEWIESELLLAPQIQQVAVFGEGCVSNTAVIIPANGQTAESIWQAIDEVNFHLPDYARISHCIISDTPFTPANQQLSGTGRNRREAIYAAYRERIKQFYRQESVYE